MNDYTIGASEWVNFTDNKRGLYSTQTDARELAKWALLVIQTGQGTPFEDLSPEEQQSVHHRLEIGIEDALKEIYDFARERGF